jgi:hypothetical protein
MALDRLPPRLDRPARADRLLILRRCLLARGHELGIFPREGVNGLAPRLQLCEFGLQRRQLAAAGAEFVECLGLAAQSVEGMAEICETRARRE